MILGGGAGWRFRPRNRRADDRLRDISSGTPFLIADVIPEAAELMTLASSMSNRIRRKTSDRQQAIAHTQTGNHPAVQDSAPSELTTPDQDPAPDIAQAVKDRLRRTREIIAVAASEAATEITAAASPGDRSRGVKIVVSLVDIPLSLWWIWGLLNRRFPQVYPLRGMA